MYRTTTKALHLAKELTDTSFEGALHMVDRLSNPDDELTKKGVMVGQIIGGICILSGIGASLFSIKVGAGLLVTGAITLTSNTLYKSRQKK